MLPNFFIVGAAKSGTSSLDRYLSQHPEIFLADKKEAHHFAIPSFPPHFQGPGDDGMNLYTIRDRGEYLRLFDGVETEKAVGESSVFYLYYSDTARRIKAEIPTAKILILLRNPVERAFSAYMHLVRDQREDIDFASSLRQEQARMAMDYEPLWYYKELGLYAEQVKKYIETFGQEQVKVLLFEEFVKNPQQALTDVFEFLGVDTDFAIDTSVRHNESGVPKSRWVYNFIAKPHGIKEWVKPLFPAKLREKLGNRAKSIVLERVAMEPEIRDELEAFFEPEIEQLESVLDRDLGIWRQAGNRRARSAI